MNKLNNKLLERWSPWILLAAIILLCKPASIALYSLGLTVVAQNLLGLWR